MPPNNGAPRPALPYWTRDKVTSTRLTMNPFGAASAMEQAGLTGRGYHGAATHRLFGRQRMVLPPDWRRPALASGLIFQHQLG